jgi:high-affinity nickel-transport protein
MARIFGDRAGALPIRIGGAFAFVVLGNAAAWAWAFAAFHAYPILLGTALLAYGLGLRHAVDADHIAAIDNVTRKLMQEGQRPVGTGLFFSLGHSSVVVLASLAIAAMASAFRSQFTAFQNIGGVVGTLVSAGFLLAIAAMNLAILSTIFRTFRRVKAGGAYVEADLDLLLAGRGLLARLLRPLFRMIRSSAQMFPLGFLFGLGFDTASEIALLGISAAQATHGLPLWSIMAFPALFAAGMSLIDTADGILMLGAYGWAFLKPLRKLYYNMAITLVSALVALLIGGIEALGLIGDKLALKGAFWNGIGALNDHFGTLGFLIIALFVVCWLASAAIYRWNGYDRLEAET